jgi:hypothetical protein
VERTRQNLLELFPAVECGSICGFDFRKRLACERRFSGSRVTAEGTGFRVRAAVPVVFSLNPNWPNARFYLISLILYSLSGNKKASGIWVWFFYKNISQGLDFLHATKSTSPAYQ